LQEPEREVPGGVPECALGHEPRRRAGDLNPIEQLFAKFKHFMPSAEPRTVEATWRKVGALLDIVSLPERRLCLDRRPRAARAAHQRTAENGVG
jgi:hypothetical protein